MNATLRSLPLSYLLPVLDPHFIRVRADSIHGDSPLELRFAVLVCRHQFWAHSRDSREQTLRRRGEQDEYIMIRAVVYTEPEKRKHKLVAQNSKALMGLQLRCMNFQRI